MNMKPQTTHEHITHRLVQAAVAILIGVIVLPAIIGLFAPVVQSQPTLDALNGDQYAWIAQQSTFAVTDLLTQAVCFLTGLYVFSRAYKLFTDLTQNKKD
jgi:hypothetical protein